jgi:RNA polymerase sigma-70 factor (ECF subfamily)
MDDVRDGRPDGGAHGLEAAVLSAPARLSAFQACRGDLVALAYRMLGDVGRAEDMVQEAWLRWERQSEAPASPKAFLVTIVTRLCLNELDSARARREESRADRLPEPVDLEAGGLSRVERLEEVSMAFLVMLQRLSPAERAVLLLHEVFDFEHQEIAGLVGTTVPSSRKLLERARKHVATERRLLAAPPDEHRRLLQAFLGAASAGNVEGLVAILADDAVMISDGGPDGRTLGGQRNLPRPLEGAARVAAFVAAASSRGRLILTLEERVLNGRPAVVFRRDGEISSALTLAVADGKIQRVFFHADASRLGHV